MLTSGLILGTLSWLSGLISLWHAPLWVRKLVINHYVLADMLSTVMTYMLISSFSHSIIAVAACIFVGLLTNFTIMALRHVFKEWWLS